MKSNIFYSWKTQKVANQFKAFVFKNTSREVANEKGSFLDTELVKEETLPTRARAASRAKAWKTYYTHLNR